ncbi:MAG: XRE family transcriptional regulator [Nitrolancea sp.]
MTTKMPSTINDQVYRASVMTPLSEIARTLEQVLSRRLTAVIVGLKDGKTIARWAAGDTQEIRNEDTEQRLRMTYQIVLLLLRSQDSQQTVKAWFIGLNPQLGDVSPAEAIRSGQLQETLAAARAFVIGG